METVFCLFLVPILGVILDILLGDPKWMPHPVRLLGKGMDVWESMTRSLAVGLRFSGWVAVIVFAVGSWVIAELLMGIPYVGWFMAVYLAYAGLALGCLVKEARKVLLLVDDGEMEAARQALGMLVSRDTSGLDVSGIYRTLAETVSENLNDGFVAPVFYLALFGPGGMWAYKAVSTLDSMWGYRTNRFRELGYGAAKTDDLLAWIPARITAWALMLIGKRRGLDYKAARENVARDAFIMESPNAGWPMAAAAWLIGGQMGGPAVYFGKVKDKPILGPEGRQWDKAMVRELILLCKPAAHYTAWACILAFGLIRLAF